MQFRNSRWKGGQKNVPSVMGVWIFSGIAQCKLHVFTVIASLHQLQFTFQLERSADRKQICICRLPEHAFF